MMITQSSCQANVQSEPPIFLQRWRTARWRALHTMIAQRIILDRLLRQFREAANTPFYYPTCRARMDCCYVKTSVVFNRAALVYTWHACKINNVLDAARLEGLVAAPGPEFDVLYWHPHVTHLLSALPLPGLFQRRGGAAQLPVSSSSCPARPARLNGKPSSYYARLTPAIHH
jgi:hypothetical protein